MQRDNGKRVAGNLVLLTLGTALCANIAIAQGQGASTACNENS